ncbi:MAG TPA: hypothetical protein VHW66_07345 [Stellaceae bacterium]|jgi:hypothetical protein|nr:hypothetical protein [Stellaceae bacterium]
MAGPIILPYRNILPRIDPARYTRPLKPEEREYMRWVAAHYRELAEEYRSE